MSLYHSLKRISSSLILSFILLVSFNKTFGQVSNLSGVDSTIIISHTVFLPKTAYPSGAENWGVTVGDIDKDGDIDVITCSNTDSKVTVHMNDGKGKFDNYTQYTAGSYNRSVIVGDFNRDTWLDIATVSVKDNNLNWMLNNGSGSFYPKKSIVTGPFAHDLVYGDVNQDGFEDIVTVTNTNNMVNVHYGDGAGNFAGALSFATGNIVRSVVICDINKDNIPDILTGSDDRCVNIHKGLGGGKFAPKVSLLAGGANWGLGVGDFDKDGDLDIATCSYNDGVMCTIKNLGNMKFEAAKCLVSGDYNFDLTIGDFDLDGDLDIVVASTRDEVINVHLNDGKGIFSEKSKITSGNWNSGIASADFDNDKDLDIATSSIKDSKMNIHRNVSIDPDPVKTGGCVFGTVTDKETGQPLVAVVAVLGPDGMSIGTMKTDVYGKFRICAIPFGKGYTLTAKSNGYPKYSSPFDFAPSSPGGDVQKDVQLQKIKETFVYGKIIDQESRAPLANAKVVIKDKNGSTIATLLADGSGNYKQTLKFDDNYEITASMEGYNEKSSLFSLYLVNYPLGLEKNFELLKIKPKTTACVHGNVIDSKTKEKLSNATITVLDEQGNTVKKIESPDGSYEACVPFGKYDITATRKGYMYKVDSFEVRLEDAEKGVTKDMELIKFEIGLKLILKNIYYDVAKATLRPESRDELNRLIKIMNENPTLVVELGGHTDSDGSDASNEILSQNRAQSVVDYLLEAGIPTDRLVAKGYGEKQPIVANDTPANKQLNRRTEFLVLAF